MFDEDHSGKLSTGELTHLLCHDESSDGTELDECPIADTVPAVLREADEDHDGALSRAEFEALMRSPPSERLELYESRLKRRSKKKLASSAPLPAQNGDAAPGQQQ